MSIDYRKRYKDYAVFVPAVSEMYARLECQPNPKRTFPIPQHDLNFLKPNCNLFHISAALYSAGQAAKSDSAAAKTDCMFTGRVRDGSTVIIGDSGGYQIQTNAIKFKGDETRFRMFDWLSRNAEYSMILDFPTGGINIGNVDPHIKRLEEEGADLKGFCRSLGFDPNDHQRLAFSTCLYQTMQNNDYFEKNQRPGATKFLNVLQGRNVEESDIWYEHVKKYDFDGGWGFAGPLKENFEMTMKRLIQLRDEHHLEKKDWIHILGVGKMCSGAIYTTMQRAIRESINPKLTISYDVSSAFSLAAYGKCFYGHQISKSGWSLSGDKVDGREFLPGGPRCKLPFLDYIQELWQGKGLKTVAAGGNGRLAITEVGKKLLMEDICVNSDPKFTSTWDVVSYGLMMNHNLQAHLEAVFESQDVFSDPTKNHLVPDGLLVLRDLIPEIFRSENPYAMIKKNAKALNYLAGEPAERGVQDLSNFDMPNISSHLASLGRLETTKSIKQHKFAKQIDMAILMDLFEVT